MKKTFSVALTMLVIHGLGNIAFADVLSSTNFDGFMTGVSVNNQPVASPAGWGVSNPAFNQSVVPFGGGNVWQVSNAVTSGSFGDHPFAPRPGGIPMMTATNPTNSNPQFFAGESSTGAMFSRFFAEFDVRSATGAAQPGARITVSPDNGSGGRQAFLAIADNGATGIDISTFDVNMGGGFVGPITIASNLNYTDFHTLGIEILFNDGANNDVVNYFVNGALAHTSQSWEQFYSNFQPVDHALGVPVQTLLFRLSGTAAPGTAGAGFYIDNVEISADNGAPVPEPASLAIWAGLMGGAGLVKLRAARRSSKTA